MKMSFRSRIECPKYHQLIPKRGTKSNIWQFFGLPGNETGKIISDDISICKLCKHPVSSKGGSTSNLRSHLKLYHPAQHYSLSSFNVLQNTALGDPVSGDGDDQAVLPQIESQTVLLEPSASANSNSYEATFIESMNNKISQKNVQKTIRDYAPLDTRSAKRCTNAITKFLAIGMQPYSLVEEESFKEMAKTLNPRYIMPGRKYFSRTATI